MSGSSDMHKEDVVEASMGAMIFSFQKLEYEMVEILCSMIDTPTLEIIGVLKKQVMFSQTMDIILIIGNNRLPDDKLKARLSEVVTKAKAFAVERNKYIHSHYDDLERNFITNEVRYERSKSRLGKKKANEKEHEKFDPSALYNLSQEIRLAVVEVVDLQNEIIDLLHPEWRQPEEDYDYSDMEVPREWVERIFRSIEVSKDR